MVHMKVSRIGALLFGVAFLLVQPLVAQIDRAGISGTITDQSKAVLSGAKVVVESDANGLRREAQSNDAGIYLLPQLPIGQYTVTFRMDGFQSKTYSVTLAVGQVRTMDVELAVGAVSTDVQIIEDFQSLQQNNAEVG